MKNRNEVDLSIIVSGIIKYGYHDRVSLSLSKGERFPSMNHVNTLISTGDNKLANLNASRNQQTFDRENAQSSLEQHMLKHASIPRK